jgi:hypothetical protein
MVLMEPAIAKVVKSDLRISEILLLTRQHVPFQRAIVSKTAEILDQRPTKPGSTTRLDLMANPVCVIMYTAPGSVSDLTYCR